MTDESRSGGVAGRPAAEPVADQDVALVGREIECRALETLVRAAGSGRSGSLLLEGEPGIGKTALVRFAAGHAGRLRVLETEGVEPEADLPFAGLHRLLLPVLSVLDAIPSVQADALRAAFGLGSGAGDRFLVGAGVLSLLAEVAEPDGVLCLVDNAQWLDQESADALGFAVRRLGVEGIAVLFAAGDGQGHAFAPAGVPTLRVRGLDDDAAGRLLHDSAAAPAVRRRLIELSRGNPLALRELPAALTAAQRSGREPLPVDLPLGDRIREALLAKVRGMPDETGRLLLAVAAEPAGDLAVLTRTAAALGLDIEALEPAERAGLVTVTTAGARLTSPLLGSALYADAPYVRRRTVHAALAEAFTESHLDRWAWHRAAIAESTDPVLADELERSADASRDRAGSTATSAALERSAELTADPRQRARRLVAAASAAWSAGRSERAEQLLARAERLGSDDPRIGMVRGLMTSRLGRPADAVVVLRSAAERLAAEDRDTAIEALTAAMEAASLAGDYAQAPALADLASRLADEQTLPLTGLLTGMARLVLGDPANAARPLRSVRDRGGGFDDPVWIGWAAVAALFLGDDASALRLYDRAIDRARSLGALALLPFLLEQRALEEWTTGRFSFAEADASESVRLAEELGMTRPPLLAMATLSTVAWLRGRLDEAGVMGTRTMAAAEDYGLALPAALVSAAFLERDLALGHMDDALGRAARITEADAATTHPLVLLVTTPTRLEALTRAGRPVGPHEVERFRRWVESSPSPSSYALLALCEALTAAPDHAPDLFEQCLRLFEQAGRPYHLARARLLFGELLRRRRRRGEAREHLRAAVDGFDRLGCVVWADRARQELRAAGGTSHDPDENVLDKLTPQELQIVRLVGEGRSNREVAGQLFLSPRTVEYHLYKVYPKLGITSRADLIRRMSVPAAG